MDIASCIEARVRRQLRDQLEEQLMAAKQDDAILAGRVMQPGPQTIGQG